ncbi:hybrid sensor histidine kinase/response regulator [Massilia oculi]|uniref:hybrid sensor histidine kinase/response regulator n=1 Tax=Massilia oculi TaxID=945844 RepID=UPI0028AA2658|nr:ATP-binding protein [Massilia oculi]
MTGASSTMTRRPLRAYLLWLVLATLLPGVVGASLLFIDQYRKSSAQYERNVMHTVRALVSTLDSKMLRAQAIAQTLSTLDAMAAGDFERVHRQAREALGLAGTGMAAVLRDAHGQQLLNTGVPYGAPLPLDSSAQLAEVFASGRPAISNLFISQLSKQPIASIDVPVMVDGRVAYVFSVRIRPDYFNDMLTPKSVPEGARASVIDRGGFIFARNLSPELFVGRRVTTPLYNAIMRASEGATRSISQEGTELRTFYARSELSGWHVGVGVPREKLSQALFEPVAALLTGVTLLFAIGLWLAWQIGGRLASSVQGLTAPAVALGKGEDPPRFTQTYVRETAEVAEAIGAASRLLGERAQALAVKEAELRDAHRMARFGTWHLTLATGAVETSESVPYIYGRELSPYAQQRGTLLPEESWEKVDALLRELARDGGNGRLQLQVLHGEGHRIWIDMHCEAVHDAEGRVTAVRGTIQDVTDRVNAEEGLREADRRKNEFLAMLAHELRNPLAPIASGAQLLGQDNLDPARTRQISGIIARQARHMAGLVDDLLDVSRVTRGLVALSKDRIDINEVVLEALEQVGEPLRQKRHHLQTALLPAPAWVMGDRKRLVQVVGNLLHNAVKFTQPAGELKVALELDEKTLRIVVADNGIGMLPHELERAFEMFVQGERTPDRTQGGLGIGLALVRSLVQLHGGSVAVESPGQGQGSTFTVTLPRCAERRVGAPGAGFDAATATSAPALKVMVVDDNVDAAQVLAMYVGAAGHEVAVEHDPFAALARAGTFAPDACLLDIGLPGMDGHELARRLRARPATSGALLVAVTGYGQAQDREASRNAGFDHHLVKPVDMGELERILAAASAANGGAAAA